MDLPGIALIIAASASPITAIGGLIVAIRNGAKADEIDRKLTMTNGETIAECIERESIWLDSTRSHEITPEDS
jgi:hypothetical protein